MFGGCVCMGRVAHLMYMMMYSRFGEKTNNLQECLPPRQTRPKRNASGFEKDLVPGTDWMSVKAQKRNLDSEKEVHGRGSNLPRFIKW